jgi:MFS transporter, SP family, sugar:H+ symporter
MIPLGLIFVVPTIQAIGMLFIPESPRWLVSRGKVEQARKSLIWLRPDRDLIESELAQMQLAIEEERHLTQGAAVLDMFRGTSLRRTILSVGAVSVQGTPTPKKPPYSY